MLRKSIAMLIVLVLVVGLTVPALASWTGYVTSTGLYIREKPSSSAKALKCPKNSAALTILEEQVKGVRNLNVDVREENGTVVFLHKIVEGSASRSYGIHVARIAGVPQAVLDAAEEKLHELEAAAAELNPARESVQSHSLPEEIGEPVVLPIVEQEAPMQLSFFGFAPNPVVERLKSLDLMNITPSQAFEILEELKKAAEK